MHVILRPAWNACHFAARWECMSFCGPLGMHVILRPAWSAKFILWPAFSECYFADRQNMIMTLFLGMRPKVNAF
ncbi:MAG: hypothetical protein DRQ99_10550 [Candidatus Parabeggiatoa sp. nov. 3]|nr:MAG: hypothetical protein DRQ99_10550 [Gammaproteobacteria bacterium]